jgi:4-hydroxy-tetrahydrodipicolinate synthase
VKYIVATMTPFRKDGALDLDLVKRHLRFLEINGVDTIMPGGSNGEFPSMTLDERKQLLETVIENKGSMKILAHTSSCSLSEAVELTKHAQSAGADYVVLCPPFYYPSLPVNSLAEFFERVFQSVQLPIYLYNVPKFTKNPLELDLVERMKAQPNFKGIKDTSGSIENVANYKRNFPELEVYTGGDELITGAMQVGAGGVVSGLGNVFPWITRDIFQALDKRADADTPQELAARLRSILNPYPRYACYKYAMSLVGLPISYARLPHPGLMEEQKAEIARLLEREGVLHQAAV